MILSCHKSGWGKRISSLSPVQQLTQAAVYHFLLLERGTTTTASTTTKASTTTREVQMEDMGGATNWGKAVSLVSYIKPVWRKLALCANLNLIRQRMCPTLVPDRALEILGPGWSAPLWIKWFSFAVVVLQIYWSPSPPPPPPPFKNNNVIVTFFNVLLLLSFWCAFFQMSLCHLLLWHVFFGPWFCVDSSQLPVAEAVSASRSQNITIHKCGCCAGLTS